jgi:hypothetical protein
MAGFLPNALLSVSIWALVRAESFSGESDWSKVIPENPGSDAGGILLFLVGIAMLSVILQPLQTRLVRVLEGYWEGWPPLARLSPIFVEYQYRRRRSIEERRRAKGPPDQPLAPLQVRARLSRERARLESSRQRHERKLGVFPQKEEQLLPTALGNALRAGETTAGERYGLDTLSSWPRIYQQFSDRLATSVESARTGIDAAVNLCFIFFILTMLSIAAFYDEAGVYWIPFATAVLCGTSYLGAVAAALDFSMLLQTAYDLHRFDLLKALHYQLPADNDEEMIAFDEISKLFGMDPNQGPAEAAGSVHLKYDHRAKG